jgi:hypothetical protein
MVRDNRINVIVITNTIDYLEDEERSGRIGGEEEER